MNNKLLIMGSAGVPARYGGFETLAEHLARNLCDDYSINITCTTKLYSKKEQHKKWLNINRIFIKTAANGLSSVFYDFQSLLLTLFNKYDYVLILGSSGTLFLPLIKLLSPGTRFIFHPDGIEWKREKWNAIARTYLKLSSNLGCSSAHAIVIDNKALLKHYSKYKNKIQLITYGVNLYPKTQKRLPKSPYWLTIARAEPENNLSLLFNTFSSLTSENWIVLTNWKDNSYGLKLKEQAKIYKNISVLKANFDSEYVGSLLQGCSGYIHGHSSGGTNPSLVTAMQFGKTILCHKNEFNIATTEGKAQYFSDKHELQQLIMNVSPKNSNNDALVNLASEKYNWARICEQYHKMLKKL